MDILRIATAGSVDDGKSTLIGRLLYDSKAIFEDQLEAIKKTSEQRRHDASRQYQNRNGSDDSPAPGEQME